MKGMESKILKADFTQLTNFVKAVGAGHVVKVGILGGKTNRKNVGHRTDKTGTHAYVARGKAALTNAEVGARNEFGTFEKPVTPARSFLRMPIQKLGGKILEEVKALGAGKALAQGKVKLVLKYLGIACENAIQTAFDTHGFGMWAPNSPTTVMLKGSDQPLIDSAQLRRSITSRVE